MMVRQWIERPGTWSDEASLYRWGHHSNISWSSSNRSWESTSPTRPKPLGSSMWTAPRNVPWTSLYSIVHSWRLTLTYQTSRSCSKFWMGVEMDRWMNGNLKIYSRVSTPGTPTTTAYYAPSFATAPHLKLATTTLTTLTLPLLKIRMTRWHWASTRRWRTRTFSEQKEHLKIEMLAIHLQQLTTHNNPIENARYQLLINKEKYCHQREILRNWRRACGAT